ncbi:thiamine phosphate synthase [Rubrivirga marina]|uniref:thiamine phosphate synthase n=1 Tax=Rubrivirga marina TaxID=1196024 RepID=UPI0015C706CC|nr:thiamine phosphate synthase [Rubrivirga marina]
MLIADGFATGRVELPADEIRSRVVELVEAGVPWVSLRDQKADDGTFAEAAHDVAEAVRAVRSDVTLSVHGRLDVAQSLDAGLHVGRLGASLEEAVAAGVAGPVGVSAHSASAALAARKGGADYVTFSPVFATRTHPDTVPTGIDPLRLAAERSGLPVLALGGMTPPRARIARLVGAHGAAAISSLLFAWDAARTVGQFLDAVAE